ncbi:HupE/UreJ family protein [Myxococcota bacterium]|nr:HupE/UreJ family protein [Myxococcota bacterium]
MRTRNKSIKRWVGVLQGLVAWLMVAQAAGGHPEGMTLSTIEIAQEGIRIETVLPDRFFSASVSSMTIASEESTSRREQVARGYILQAAGDDCSVSQPPEAWRLPEIGSRRYVVHYRCSRVPEELSVYYALGVLADEGHENFVQIQAAGQRMDATLSAQQRDLAIPVAELVAEAGRPLDARLEAPELLSPGPLGFLVLGFEHILGGLDHLVFLVGLFLVSMGKRAVLAVVSAFTLGHSATLALSSLGIYSPVPWIAESAIALSVVYLGVDNLLALRSGRTSPCARPSRFRWMVALGFGLVHGFGFSYVLKDLGLPDDAMFSSLLGFNAGVELGQLLVVAALIPLLGLAWRRFSYAPISAALSFALVATGSFWLIERTLLA